MTARPRALRSGDLVGIAAPSSPVEAGHLARGVAEIEALGFSVRLGAGVQDRTGFTAGTVETRLQQLRDLLADPEVAAVWCARGGAGAGRLLRGLAPGLVERNPKLIVGYSDVTWLHLVLGGHGLSSLHGPMVAWELAEGEVAYDRESLWHGLTGEGDPYRSGPGELGVLRRGEAEGVLRGGCLSILAAAAGTPWALRPAGEPTILFLEDVDERPYRIDRMLLQLEASGALHGVRGIVFGEMKGCDPPRDAGYSLEDALGAALAGLDVPVAIGLPSGHATAPNVTLPLGVRARLRCDEEGGSLEVLEAAVS